MPDRVAEIYKRPGCKLVNLQSGGSFKVPTALFRAYPLKPGDEIETGSYLRLLRQEENRHALQQAVSMLETRDRSREEILGKLTGAGYSEAAAEAACERLAKGGYLDDRRYAQALLERLGKRYGALRLKRELRLKGIQQDLIEELLTSMEEGNQLASAVAQAQKSLRGKAGDPGKMYSRAYASLARRGYPPSIVRAALEIVLKGASDAQSDA